MSLASAAVHRRSGSWAMSAFARAMFGPCNYAQFAAGATRNRGDGREEGGVLPRRSGSLGLARARSGSLGLRSGYAASQGGVERRTGPRPRVRSSRSSASRSASVPRASRRAGRVRSATTGGTMACGSVTGASSPGDVQGSGTSPNSPRIRALDSRPAGGPPWPTATRSSSSISAAADGRPPIGIGGERAPDHLLELGRVVGDELAGQRVLAAHHREHAVEVGVAVEAARAGGELVEHHAEREHVGAVVDRSPRHCSGDM